MRGLRPRSASSPRRSTPASPRRSAPWSSTRSGGSRRTRSPSRCSRRGPAARPLRAALGAGARAARDVGRDAAAPRPPPARRRSASRRASRSACSSRPAGRSSRSEVIVFPGRAPISPELLRQLGATAPRAGAPPRAAAATSTTCAATGRATIRGSSTGPAAPRRRTLTVRELEAETTEDTRLVLVGTGTPGSRALEAALSEAASIAAHLIRAGAGVELVGPGFSSAWAAGAAHLARVLTALALYDPGAPGARGDGPGRARGRIARSPSARCA